MESLNKDPTGIFKMFFGEKEDKRMKYSEFIGIKLRPFCIAMALFF